MGMRMFPRLILIIFSIFFAVQVVTFSAQADESCGDGGEGGDCRECNVCGNGICEMPENAEPQSPSNPSGCPEDCEGEDGIPNQLNDPQYCNALVDLPNVQVINCDDNNICTVDTCTPLFGTIPAYSCSYESKVCSGAISDACCPVGCVEDSNAPNYDTDCCGTPTDQGTPTPTPTSIPTPIPNVTPNPSEPGQGTPLPSIIAMQLQGSGDLCSLHRNASPNWFSVCGILALVGFMGLFRRNLRRK